MVGNFTQVFGGNPVKPAVVNLLELVMAADTTLSWPAEVSATAVYFASIIDTTASVANLSLLMPNATLASPGQSALITNVGANTFTVKTNAGVQIAQIAAGQQWLIYLFDNSTVGGLWRAVQMAATTSNAQAAALAGTGLGANGTRLDVVLGTFLFSVNTFISKINNATLFVFQGVGATQTLQIDLIANLESGWWCAISNEGTANLIVTGSGGQLIDGQANLLLPPGASACVVANLLGNFHTFGTIALPVSVANGGTGASNPSQALINLGGTTVGIEIFTAPSVAAVLAVLGLNSTTPTESTVSTNQTLNAGSTQTAFVCTAALQLNLPVTTSLSKIYVFYVYAQGGAVTVHPNAADSINGAGAGANFTVSIGASAFFTTDANGNWWPFFIATAGTVTSVALTAPGEFVVTGSPITTNGTLAIAKANQNANLVYAGPASGGAAAPAFRNLKFADVPGRITGVAGTANAITGVGAPVPSAYAAGDIWEFDAAHTNTGPTALNLSTLGNRNVLVNSAAGVVACQGGEIVTGCTYQVIDDGTEFVLQNPTPQEGSWTPIFIGSGTAGTFTYSIQVGRFSRIGNLVFIEAQLAISAITVNPTGSLLISGLPFASGNPGAVVLACPSIGRWGGITLDAGYTSLNAEVVNNTTQIEFIESGSGLAISLLPATGLGTLADVTISGVYRIT